MRSLYSSIKNYKDSSKLDCRMILNENSSSINSDDLSSQVLALQTIQNASLAFYPTKLDQVHPHSKYVCLGHFSGRSNVCCWDLLGVIFEELLAYLFRPGQKNLSTQTRFNVREAHIVLKLRSRS